MWNTSMASRPPPPPPPPSNQEPKREVCKYFINGGCLRGDDCTFLHELPDERHLDVNGVGFIFNANVQNTNFPLKGATLKSRVAPPLRRTMPKYRPCLASVRHQLPPALAVAFDTQPVDKNNLLKQLGFQKR